MTPVKLLFAGKFPVNDFQNKECVEVANQIRSQSLEANALHSEEAIIILTPIAIDRRAVVEATRDIMRLVAILNSIEKRIYAGDTDELFKNIGFDEQRIRHYKATRRSMCDLGIYRFDAYLTAEGFKLLEINAGPLVAGLAISRMFDVFRRRRELGAEIEEKYVSCTDTFALSLEALVKACRALDLRSIALVLDHEMTTKAPLAMAISAIQERGLEAFAVWPHEITSSYVGGPLYCAKTKIDGFLRLYPLARVISNPGIYCPISAALESGRIVEIMGSEMWLTNKGALTLLCDQRCTMAFSQEEKRIIRKYLPITRFACACSKDELLSNREKTVLKPINQWAGNGVCCGWDETEGRWRSAVEAALQTPKHYIAQERVTPVKLPARYCTHQGRIEGTDGTAMVFGLFTVGGKYAGGMIRAQRQSSSVVNLTRGAAEGIMCEMDS